MKPDLPFRAVAALGVTQIIGYGTLYYSFAQLAPAMAADLGWPPARVFGALAVALVISALMAPVAGRMMDRYGAVRVMVAGSVGAALALAGFALSSGPLAFVVGLVATEAAASLVLYNAAFAAIVQFGGQGAQQRIVHLTLIAGFASTVFWPLTAAMAQVLDWRAIYLIFAAAHILVCLPLHLTLPRAPADGDAAAPGPGRTSAGAGLALSVRQKRTVAALLLVGMALMGYMVSSVTVHMVPLIQALGLGAAGAIIAALFGPAQVASRLVNMVIGRNQAQSLLGVQAVILLTLGVAVLAGTGSVAGAVVFAILFGMGSGLMSIVAGTLPLELFGSASYGSALGRFAAARQLSGAVAPYVFALLMGGFGVVPSLWVTVLAGMACLACFAAIAHHVRPAARLA